MKILFITVPYHAGVVEVAGKWVPLYMVTLAGACREAGFECHIYDAMTKGVGMAEVERQIRDLQPDVVAVSMITSTTPDALEVLRSARRLCPAVVTVAGGIHASFMYDEIMAHDFVDYLVVGEGEKTLVELLLSLGGGEQEAVAGLALRDSEGKVKLTSPRPLLTSLDNMPMAWDLLDWQDYTYFIIPGSRLGAVAFSRGCTYSCRFCSQHKFWGQWRARTPEDLMGEIRRLYEDFQVNVILFTDDYPTPDRQRWERLLDLLIEADLPVYLLMETRAADIIRDSDILDKYRRAGFIHIYIGSEAASQERLDLFAKEQSCSQAEEAMELCRRHDIITETSVIIGLPADTRESIQEIIRYTQKLNPDFAHFLTISPWPYADMYPELKPFISSYDYRRYNLVDPVLKPQNMTLDEVDEIIIQAYREFYMAKFTEIMTMSDFKRRYMLTAIMRIMNNSFLRRKMGDMSAAMPESMRAALTELQSGLTPRNDVQLKVSAP
ncbi:cobalamin-dependent protein [Desulfobacterota bacterium M19]